MEDLCCGYFAVVAVLSPGLFARLVPHDFLGKSSWESCQMLFMADLMKFCRFLTNGERLFFVSKESRC